MKILPCPFCGSENVDISIGHRGIPPVQAHYVECIECASSSNMFITIKEAKNAWNKRVNKQESK